MLPRRNRLSHREITHLKKGAKRVTAEHLFLLYKTNKETADSKVSCSVSKKVEKKAVGRNRLKRQCREAIKAHLKSVKDPIVGLISIRKTKKKLSFSDLNKEVEEVFLKVE